MRAASSVLTVTSICFLMVSQAYTPSIYTPTMDASANKTAAKNESVLDSALNVMIPKGQEAITAADGTSPSRIVEDIAQLDGLREAQYDRFSGTNSSRSNDTRPPLSVQAVGNTTKSHESGSAPINGHHSATKLTIAAELGLPDAYLAYYEGLWSVAGIVNGVLPAAKALTFFGKSSLDSKKTPPESDVPSASLGPGTLRKIYRLADSKAPHGQLTKNEFFRACKLIALAQAGLPIALEQLAQKTYPVGLPEIGGMDAQQLANVQATAKRASLG